MDELFSPPGCAWQRVSPRLAVARRSLLVLGAMLLVAATAALVWWVLAVPGAAAVAVLVALVAISGWAWWLVGRTTSRWGYAELAEDLYITRGALFRRLVVVPYGRMQFVDVHAGPLEQMLGIATVRLHTASPGTTAVIPGLPATEAARLRDRLTALGEAQAAGL